MTSNQDSTDHVLSTFGAFLGIVYGLIFSSFIENTIYLFPFDESIEFTFKSGFAIVIFFIVVLLGLEIFTWFETGAVRLKEFSTSTKVACYLIWLLEYYPLYYLADKIGDQTLSDREFSRSILYGTLVLYSLLFCYKIPQFFDLLFRSTSGSLQGYLSNSWLSVIIQAAVIVTTVVFIRQINQFADEDVGFYSVSLLFCQTFLYFAYWLRRFIHTHLSPAKS